MVRVALDPVEDGEHFERLDLDAGLLPHLAHQRLGERLAQLDGPAGNDPAPVERLLAAPDQQHAALVHQHSPDAHDGGGGAHGAGCGSSPATSGRASGRRRSADKAQAAGPESV